ncbi:hypothetical protein GALMADRAFT_219821 [Galerina marginata CBS 339.88]|uniref:Uncharacterized protein n=1 Tax=Galerina marginata (strain CBS 339.88) TaxID=685588 RepID=A0A067TY89_GALM3|nr:hypothetical protein GALMADRAFT_219821 [Galerina marginata CBS 339.88]
MDLIMDLMDLNCRYSSEALTGARISQCKEDPHPFNRTYAFRNETSLVMYWADQAAILSGMWLDDNMDKMGFPVSLERSTATWSSVLNRDDDVSPVCSGHASME